MRISSSGDKGSPFSESRAGIHQYFEAQARVRPDAIAVRCGDEEISYGLLNARANQVARHLLRLGVGPEKLVAVYLERGIRMVEGILGILKAGAAYVPIEPAYPQERIRFMLADAKPLIVLTEQKQAVPESAAMIVDLDRERSAVTALGTENVVSDVAADNAAYVIYTSGSTGTPKGVVVTHHNVIRLFRSTDHWCRFSHRDVWTLFHSFAFDFSVWELWGALCYGGKLIVVPYLISRSPKAFRQLLAREGVTVLNQTPSAFRQLIWADQELGEANDLALDWVVFGGEALDLQSLRPWFARHGDQRPQLVNMYGITETTVHVTYRPIRSADVESGRGSVIGVPLPDLTLHILDEHQRPCPVGEPGEMYVGGAGVARGYLERPELTAERFITDPFSNVAGARLYRSGDLARRLSDGDIEYLGRADAQVKIRGFRIELGEIEAALGTHGAVRECAVTAQAHPSGDKHLIAYLVCGSEPPEVLALRTFLQDRLPEYMVPAQFVFLAELPLTVNGKVDRRALPAPARNRPDLGTPYIGPVSPAERALVSIWETVLEIAPIGVQDNFFALGGDSIRSIQVLSQASQQGLHLSLEELFEHPTIQELARWHAGQVTEPPDPSPVPFGMIGESDRARLPSGLEDAYPMAKLQVGMVYHASLDPALAIFHDVFSFRFRMAWDETKLRDAVQRLAARHAIFRTSFEFASATASLQLVHREVAVPVTVEDLRARTADDQRAALVDWVEREKRNPFDWSRPPFLRLHVQRYRDDVFQFIVSFHHVIMDGWSLAAMLTELFQDYASGLADTSKVIEPPSVAYRDFILLEKRASDSNAAQEFWRSKLKEPTISQLPRWPVAMRSGGTEQKRGPETVVPKEIVKRLQGVANAAGVPLRTVLLAAHCRVMSWVSGQTDLLTGLVVNGRPQVQGGERLIGLFLNTVPFRIRAEGGTWLELVRDTFQAERELLPHRRCPLAEIQQWAGGQPLFETVFDFVQFHVYRELPGYEENSFLEDHYFEANNFTFYQTFMLDASGSELQMHCDYDPNQLCDAQVRALGEYYSATLADMATAPQARYELLSPMPPWERDRLVLEWNRTEQEFPSDKGVHGLIEDQAQRTPEAVAALFENERWTYRELNERANRLAEALRDVGVGPGVLVGMHMRRSLQMLAGLLAILKAGAAYVPLDPKYPRARLEFMMGDAGLGLVLTDQSGSSIPELPGRKVVPIESLLRDGPSRNAPNAPGPELRPGQLAYVIYTSGSTGQPKGVQISHRALVNFLCSMRQCPELKPEDTLLAITTLSFDIAALELFLPLMVGGRVVIAESNTSQDPEALAAALSRYAVTALQATPTTWRLLTQSHWAGNKRLKALCGGEAMTRELANCLLERCGQVWNVYGPTETTVWSCLDRVESGEGPVPIGRPVANTSVFVLNSGRQLVPIGTEGEIYIGGKGLAEGYLHRPEFMAERFVANPLIPGDRLYRTGDLGHFLPDGRLVCSGRTDHQIKLRGFRIELGEIEAVLGRHPAVAAAAVICRGGVGDVRLIGYYVRVRDAAARPAEFRQFLEERLPQHMVPAVLVELDALPLTPNGKVDYRSLPEPTASDAPVEVEYVAPRTPLEKQVAELWQAILKRERVGLKEDFFALGGHSLLAIQLVGRVRRQFQISLSVAALFDHPTVESLAGHILHKLVERQRSMKEPAERSVPGPAGSAHAREDPRIHEAIRE